MHSKTKSEVSERAASKSDVLGPRLRLQAQTADADTKSTDHAQKNPRACERVETEGRLLLDRYASQVRRL